MKLGVGLPMAGEWATPQNQLRVARAAEDLGYHSLWVFQRLLYALKPKRKLPRQVDTSKVDSTGASGLGRNVSGGTRPRLSWGRSVL
jgi:alkanesulfonate monooxygenase SsuD/methylene tetrahydromethanopterin reductase-like flavin-dependent oxidoreductase (luciferase family)